MIQAAHTAALGIKAQQRRLDVISNNIANVNTNGFRSVNVNFKDALYQTMQRPTQPQDDVNLRLGHGTLVSGTTRSFVQGSYLQTGGETDLFIHGDQGFFAIQTPTGQRLYTRDGSFTKSVEADGEYLVTRTGSYVLDSAGQKIKLQGKTLTVSKEGFLKNDNGDTYATLGLFNFPNKNGLDLVGTNLYQQSASSGASTLIPAAQVEVEQKVLEGSNVNMAEQLTRLIRTQRIFSLSSKALTQADQMDGIANQLR